MKREDKAVLIEKVKDIIERYENLYLLTFEKVPSNELMSIRRKLKANKGEVKWIKNTILEKAIAQSNKKEILEKIKHLLKGPTVIVGSSNPSDVAKTLYKWQKNEAHKYFKGAIISDTIYEGKDGLLKCSRLLAKEDLIVMIVLTLRSPLVRVLNGLKAKAEEKKQP